MVAALKSTAKTSSSRMDGDAVVDGIEPRLLLGGCRCRGACVMGLRVDAMSKLALGRERERLLTLPFDGAASVRCRYMLRVLLLHGEIVGTWCIRTVCGQGTHSQPDAAKTRMTDDGARREGSQAAGYFSSCLVGTRGGGPMNKSNQTPQGPGPKAAETDTMRLIYFEDLFEAARPSVVGMGRVVVRNGSSAMAKCHSNAQ